MSVLSTVHNLLLVLKMLPSSGQTSLQYLYLQNILILMQVCLAIVKQPEVVASVETHKMGYPYLTTSEHPMLAMLDRRYNLVL